MCSSDLRFPESRYASAQAQRLPDYVELGSFALNPAHPPGPHTTATATRPEITGAAITRARAVAAAAQYAMHYADGPHAIPHPSIFHNAARHHDAAHAAATHAAVANAVSTATANVARAASNNAVAALPSASCNKMRRGLLSQQVRSRMLCARTKETISTMEALKSRVWNSHWSQSSSVKAKSFLPKRHSSSSSSSSSVDVFKSLFGKPTPKSMVKAGAGVFF
mgnify:CR=1 FL=1